MNRKDKVNLMMAWFEKLNSDQKNKVAKQLFEHAVISDHIKIRDLSSARMLAEETSKPVEYWQIPYFSECGENLL